jgi:hypothetical protein
MSPRIQQLRDRLALPEQVSLFTTEIQIPPHIAALPPIERPKEAPKPPIDPYAQIMTFEQGLDRFREIFADAGTKERERRGEPKWKVEYNEQQVQIVKDLVKYFINDPSGPYNIRKGILLYGPPGCGKTQLMKRFQEFAENRPKAFEMSNMKNELGVARETPAYSIVGILSTFNRLLDEFPFTNDLGIVSHGNSYNKTYDAIIHKRHTHENKITHIVTNVPPSEFGKYFEDANASRINGMCNIILFAGTDMRTD